MATNQKVINSFLGRNVNSSGHLISDGNRLMSYSTCIAQYTSSGFLLVNTTHYSTTTSRHRNMLLKSNSIYPVIKLNAIPRGADYLINYYINHDITNHQL